MSEAAMVMRWPAQAEPRPWDDIPGVALVGIMIGVVLLIAAIRAMTGRRGK